MGEMGRIGRLPIKRSAPISPIKRSARIALIKRSAPISTQSVTGSTHTCHVERSETSLGEYRL